MVSLWPWPLPARGVVICGRRKESLDETTRLITTAGGKALAVQAGISDKVQVDKLVQLTNQSFGNIRILVNNAGIGWR